MLTDISMPVMDGLQLTRRIRKFDRQGGRSFSRERDRLVQVIALTGLSGAAVQQDAAASGVDLFLTRPLEFKRLKEAFVAIGLL